MSQVREPDDPRLSFGAAVDAYNEIRPGYPGAMFDVLFDCLPADPVIVEVGPGTGQATGDLLARGATVHAFEISPAMAAKLRDNFSTDRLTIHIGDFEAIEMPGASVDAVFSATAYHWVTPRAQLDRPANILKAGGVLAVVDLVQVTSPDDHGFFEACQFIYERYGEGHRGPPAPKRDAVDPPIRAALAGDARYGQVIVRQWDWNQTYSAADYRKLIISYSTTQMMNERDRIGLLDDMEVFINEQFGGQITRPLVVTLTTARLNS